MYTYSSHIVEVQDNSNLPCYRIDEPTPTEEEQKILENPKKYLPEHYQIFKDLDRFQKIEEKEEFLEREVRKTLTAHNISTDNMEWLICKLIDNIFLGYGKLSSLMRDESLEEIMVNGINMPVFVVHRKHGMCTTNISYENKDEINELIDWLAKNAGRKIDANTPLLDGHMPDGSRANVVIAPAAPKGSSITIRKFRRTPLTILDLIKRKSLNSEVAAFLWICVEGFGMHPCNILIAGGSGSGKTTLLNALTMFTPSHERVVTIEDTLELNFKFLENWVALEASPSLIERSNNSITMQTLVENSLRMRPDRVILGEIRGKEAETIFVAMDIGLNGSMGTIHSNTAKETTIRLTSDPMNLPVRMFPLLDLIVVANRRYDKKRGLVRRITEIGEIAGLEGDIVQIGQIYRLNTKIEEITRTEYPILLIEKIARRCRLTKQQVKIEIIKRKFALEAMIKRGITDEKEVVNLIQEYNKNSDSVLLKLGVADMLHNQSTQ